MKVQAQEGRGYPGVILVSCPDTILNYVWQAGAWSIVKTVIKLLLLVIVCKGEWGYKGEKEDKYCQVGEEFMIHDWWSCNAYNSRVVEKYLYAEMMEGRSEFIGYVFESGHDSTMVIYS